MTTADALPCMLDKNNVSLMEHFGVLTAEELESRYIISLEKYNKLINIESRLMHRMTKRTYLPAVNEYAAELAYQINEISKADKTQKLKDQKENLKLVLDGIEKINKCLKNLDQLRDACKQITDEQKKADHNAKKIVPAMMDLRSSVDAVEHIVSREY